MHLETIMRELRHILTAHLLLTSGGAQLELGEAFQGISQFESEGAFMSPRHSDKVLKDCYRILKGFVE